MSSAESDNQRGGQTWSSAVGQSGEHTQNKAGFVLGDESKQVAEQLDNTVRSPLWLCMYYFLKLQQVYSACSEEEYKNYRWSPGS